jgi:hypothetical protein
MRANKPRAVSSVDKIEKTSISIPDYKFCEWITNKTSPAIIEFGGKKISVNNETKPVGLHLISKDLDEYDFGFSSNSVMASGDKNFEYSRLKKFPRVPFFESLPNAGENCEEDGIEEMTPEIKQLFDKIASVFNIKGDCHVKLGGITYEYYSLEKTKNIEVIPDHENTTKTATKISTVKLVMRGDEVIFASTDEKKVSEFVEKNIIRVREIDLS